MQIQARIAVVKNEVRHVLPPVPDGKMAGKTQTNADMGGKLKRTAKVFLAIFMLAGDGRIDTQIYIDFRNF